MLQTAVIATALAVGAVCAPGCGGAEMVESGAETVESGGEMAKRGTEAAVLYCGSGNRVGALIALRAHLIEGIGAEEALALGKEAGLTRLEPKVREALSLSSE